MKLIIISGRSGSGKSVTCLAMMGLIPQNQKSVPLSFVNESCAWDFIASSVFTDRSGEMMNAAK